MDELNQYDTLIDEQCDMAISLSEELQNLGLDIDETALLDALATLGIQLAPCVGENIPSLAWIALLNPSGGTGS